MPEPILSVQNLRKHFPITKGIVFERTVGYVKAVDGIDFSINSGETFSLVGESGCGKTTTASLILKLTEPTAGSIWFGDKDIAHLKGGQLRDYRQSVQAVFQDPFASLDPRMRVRSILGEPLAVNRDVYTGDLESRLADALAHVGLGRKDLDLYPHEFSGGQRQRIALARALMLKPRVIVLDEPVSALDVSIRAQIMNYLKEIQQKLGVAYLLIAHGLDTVRYMSHWMGVMYLGVLVELGPSEKLFSKPAHPYTQALLSAALPSHPRISRKEIVLSGEVPSPINIPKGCRFHARCFKASPNCSTEEVKLIQIDRDHFVRCHQA